VTDVDVSSRQLCLREEYPDHRFPVCYPASVVSWNYNRENPSKNWIMFELDNPQYHPSHCKYQRFLGSDADLGDQNEKK